MPRYDSAPTLAAGLIRLARIKADMTQAQLAERAGVTQQAVSAYETGRMEPTMPTLQRLIGAAGLEMRIQLQPTSHDAYEQWLAGLSPEDRAALADTAQARAAEARLRRIRGK